MGCSLDVAVVLKNLVTKDDALPQGSPASPFLAYQCYIEMWDAISDIVRNANCTMGLYADDLTISSVSYVPEKCVWEVKQQLRQKRDPAGEILLGQAV